METGGRWDKQESSLGNNEHVRKLRLRTWFRILPVSLIQWFFSSPIKRFVSIFRQTYYYTFSLLDSKPFTITIKLFLVSLPEIYSTIL